MARVKRGSYIAFVMIAAWIVLGVLVSCVPPTGVPSDGTQGASGSNGTGETGGGGNVPAPEMHLWQDGNAVYVGSVCDFGTVCVNQSGQRTFTIVNDGEADLSLTGETEKVVTSGTDVGLFTVVSQPLSPIPPHESSSFTVRFDSTSDGVKTAAISIASDDPSLSLLTFTVTGNGFTPTAKVAATGQTTSYATGDDGDLRAGASWPNPRFTDNGDGTVTDALTGLMWEQDPGGSVTWNSALLHANNSTLAGYSDWRLANANELESLIDAEEASPYSWLDNQGFTTVSAGDYWTSTPASVATSPMFAWKVQMSAGGDLGRSDMAMSKYAWAVRDGSTGSVSLPVTGMTFAYGTRDDGDLEKGVPWPTQRFIDNKDGTVSDTLTGLVWEQSPSTTARSWADALTYANDLTLAGYTDWRLANKNELRSLVHYGKSNIAGWLATQGFSSVQKDIYWTSTTYAPDISKAWYVILEYGHMQGLTSKATSYYAWAVRGGE